MPKTFTWFPFETIDWLTSPSVCGMAAESVKGYINLLCHQWNEEGNGLPDDDFILAALAKLEGICPADKWLESTPARSSWEFFKEEILDNFELVEGRWFNPKLHGIWLKQQEKRFAQSAGGTATGQANKAKHDSKHSAKHDGKPALRAYNSQSKSLVLSQENKTTETTPVAGTDDWALDVYARWKKRGDKMLALQALSQVSMKRDQFEHSYTRWCTYHEAKGWQYAPKLAFFLNDQSYLYDPPAIFTKQPEPEEAPCYLDNYQEPRAPGERKWSEEDEAKFQQSLKDNPIGG